MYRQPCKPYFDCRYLRKPVLRRAPRLPQPAGPADAARPGSGGLLLLPYWNGVLSRIAAVASRTRRMTIRVEQVPGSGQSAQGR